jgi:hypothetical protein
MYKGYNVLDVLMYYIVLQVVFFKGIILAISWQLLSVVQYLPPRQLLGLRSERAGTAEIGYRSSMQCAYSPTVQAEPRQEHVQES